MKQLPQKDFSKIQDIKEAQEVCKMLLDINNTLKEQVQFLQQENQKLNDLLLKTSSQINVIAQMPMPEEMICLEQITKLRTASMQRTLELDEIKALDLLIKNLRTIQKSQAKKEKIIDLTAECSEEEIFKLAQRKDE